jgi:hypothetical protein
MSEPAENEHLSDIHVEVLAGAMDNDLGGIPRYKLLLGYHALKCIDPPTEDAKLALMRISEAYKTAAS